MKKQNKKRFEFVLPIDLHDKAAKRAKIEGMSLGLVLRCLIEQWVKAEIHTESKSRQATHKGPNDVEFSLCCDARLLYEFNVFVGGHGHSPTVVIQSFMRMCVAGRVDINLLMCDDCD